MAELEREGMPEQIQESRSALDYTVRPEDRVPLGRKIAYSLGVVPEPLFMGTIANFIVLFYNSVLGCSATLIGLLLFVPRFWDAITDPFIGKWSDGCSSKMGRRRPFILVGGITTMITFVLLWTPLAPTDATINLPFMEEGFSLNLLWLLIVGVLFFTAYTAFSIPYGALAFEMSPDYKERTSILAIRKFFHSFGEMVIGSMPWLGVQLTSLAVVAGTALGTTRLEWLGGNERAGYGLAALTFGSVCMILVLASFWGTKEKEATRWAHKMSLWKSMSLTLRNRLFVRLTISMLVLVLCIYTLASYMNYLIIYYLDAKGLLAIYGLVTGALNMPMALFVGWLANHLGKVSILVASVGTLAVASFSTYFTLNPDYPHFVFVTGFFFALGWTGVLVMTPAITADIIDIDELETGYRREGSYGGVYGFIFKFAVAFAAPILGLGVDWAGFNAELGTSQTPETIFRLRMLTSVVAGSLALVAMLILWRFPLTAERAMEVRRELEARRGHMAAMQD